MQLRQILELQHKTLLKKTQLQSDFTGNIDKPLFLEAWKYPPLQEIDRKSSSLS